MNAFKLVFSAKTCFKVAVRSVKNGEAIVFLVDPYLMITYSKCTNSMFIITLHHFYALTIY